MRPVDRFNVGTLPVFGNFSISYFLGTTQDYCNEMYNRRKSLAELLLLQKAQLRSLMTLRKTASSPDRDYKG
jgi:hypothetical protein